MPLVNLIKEERLAKGQRESRARLFFLTFSTVTTLGVLAFGYFFIENQMAGGTETKLQKQMVRLEPIMKQIKDNNKTLDGMGPRLTTLQDAQEATSRWRRILDHLARNTPQSVWLTSVRCNNNDASKPVSMNMTGMSDTQDDVADFLLRLQGCDDLENVSLKLTQEKLSGQTKGIEFQIDAEIKGTLDKKAKDEKESKTKKKGGSA